MHTTYTFATDLLVIRLLRRTFHMANLLWKKTYKPIMLANYWRKEVTYKLSWHDSCCVLDERYTTFSYSMLPRRQRVSSETHGWQSANVWHKWAFSFCDWVNYLECQTKLLIYILRKRYMFLVKYSIMRLHTDLNCRYKCNLCYYITICVFVSCGIPQHSTCITVKL